MKRSRYAMFILIAAALVTMALPALAASARSHFDWAMLYLAAELPSPALDSLKKAVNGEPRRAEVRVALGMLFASLGFNKEAIEQYRAALSIDGVSGQVYALLGEAYRDSGDETRARWAYERCLQEDAASVTALSGLGLIDLNRSAFAKARERFARALELAHDRPAGYMNLADALVGLGSLEQAVSTLKDGITKVPGEPEMPYDLARLLEKLGRPDEARAFYEMALKWDPSFAPAKQALN